MPTGTATPDASELIDRLYAALFSEAPWQDFADRSSNLLPNGKSMLFLHDKASGAGAISLTAGLDDGMLKKFNDYYHSVNPWVDHAMIRPLGKLMQADEMLPRDDLKRTEFFHDFLRPQEVETGLGVTLHRQDGLHVFFSILCANAAGDQLNEGRRSIALLVPHLDRAFRIRGGAAAMDGGLQPPSEGTLQIDARLRVIAADARALSLLAETEALSIGPLGRLVCKDPDLLSCLHHVLNADAPPAVQHRHIRRKGGALPLHACLYRPGHAGCTFLPGADCFMRLKDPALALPEGVRRFCAMHQLTGAEAAIVAGLAAGLTLDQIAAKRRTSPSTVRTQLKTILWKTDCNRQAEIICQVAIMAQSHGPAISVPPLIAGRGHNPD